MRIITATIGALVALVALPATAHAHDDTEKMCHEGQTIEVPNDEVAEHLAHGDTDGKCVPVTTTAAPTTTEVTTTTTQAPSTTAATTTVPASTVPGSTTTTVAVGIPPTVPTVPVAPEPPASIPECVDEARLVVLGDGTLTCALPPVTVEQPCLMAIEPFETQTCELPTTVSTAQPTALPSTGSSTWMLTLTGLGLTGIGGVLTAAVRRRR